jgi:hypothetical protein
VGPQTRVLALEPVVQFAHDVPSLIREETTNYITGRGQAKWFFGKVQKT